MLGWPIGPNAGPSRRRWRSPNLTPLLDNEEFSAFSMTEPRGGSDPTQFTCGAELDGDEWIINGEKWFTSHARFADFLILLAVTDRDAEPHRRMSMFVVPSQTPGVNIVRNVGMAGFAESEGSGTHAYIRYENARVPANHILGQRGEGFVVAQTRLGGGRIHHAMRTVGQVRYAFDMLCERALSRFTDGSQLSRKQAVEHFVADSWIQLEQFRLLVLQTAWKIDKYNDYRKVRDREILCGTGSIASEIDASSRSSRDGQRACFILGRCMGPGCGGFQMIVPSAMSNSGSVQVERAGRRARWLSR